MRIQRVGICMRSGRDIVLIREGVLDLLLYLLSRELCKFLIGIVQMGIVALHFVHFVMGVVVSCLRRMRASVRRVAIAAVVVMIE